MDVKHEALERRVLFTAIGDQVNRMIPPLIASKKDVDQLIRVMRESIDEAAAKYLDMKMAGNPERFSVPDKDGRWEAPLRYCSLRGSLSHGWRRGPGCHRLRLVKRIAGGDIILQIKTVDGIESHIGLFIKLRTVGSPPLFKIRVTPVYT